MQKSGLLWAILGVAVMGFSAAGCRDSNVESVEVRIRLPGATATITRGTVLVDYAKSGAKPKQAAGKPACTSILPHVSCQFSDDGAGRLSIQAEAPQGFSAPVDLAVCRMVPSAPGTDAATIAAGLAISLADARGSDGQPLPDQQLAKSRHSGSPNAAPPSDAAPHIARGGRGDDSGAVPGAGVPDRQPDASDGPASEQGMIVTREDLAARERKRAEDELRKRGSERQEPTAMTPGAAPFGSDEGAALRADDGSEEEGGGSNEPTDYDERAAEYAVRFDLAGTAASVGALQFDVDYRGSGGGWLGAAGGVACRWLVQAALHACNDKRSGSLSCAVVDQTGFSGPTPLMECSFKSRNTVAVGDFSVRVVDASDPELTPINARVFVAGVYPR